MNFTIITPSFNQLDYLKRCVASVADQVSGRALNVKAVEKSLNKTSTSTCDGLNDLNGIVPVTVHHHIQDACSVDGTREFLAEYLANSKQRMASDSPSYAERLIPSTYSFGFQSERDDGMYDAINKGVAFALNQPGASLSPFNQATPSEKPSTREFNDCNLQRSTQPGPSSVVAWLNCDEQYLPGTLQKVAAFFEEHPQVDILFGGMLMVDDNGSLLACRKAMPMRRVFLEASFLYDYSCAMFFRRTAWERLGGLDTAFRNAGDEELIRRAMKQRMKTAVLDDYLSVFTYAEDNLSSDPVALKEHEALKRSGSIAGRLFKLPVNLVRLAEKAVRGGLIQRGPVQYAIYKNDPAARTRFRADNPGCKWPDGNKPYLLSHRLKNRF